MSNLLTATTDSVARFVKADGDPQRYGFKLTRRWEHVHAAYVDTLIVALNNVKRYTDPKADKQSYTGTFIQSASQPEVDGEDAIDIVQQLTKVRLTANDSNAQLVEQNGDPLHAGYRLTREWKYFDPNAADTTFTAEWGKTSYSNPKADNQSYTGTFAHSVLNPQKNDDQTITLRQTLTKTKSATDSSDADLLNAEGDPAVAGSKIVRAWHYIDPTSVDDRYIALDLVSSYPNGMKASGQLYPGKYIVSRVRAIETEDRTFRIEQDNIKVRTITADTGLINPLVERRKNEIHPFGEGRGTSYSIIFKYINLDPASDTKLMAISDATLEGKMGAGYDLIDRKTTREEDRTLTFWMLSEKKTRIDWAHSLYNTPDHTDKQNPSRDDEQITRTWFGIDNNDSSAVRADLYSDTLLAAIKPGYSLMSVRQRDNDDGSDDWEQVILKTHNDTRSDSRYVAPHSIEHSAIIAKHTEYRNYKAANIPADPAITSGYKFVSKELRLNANGLLDKVFVQEKPKASNAVTSGKPARSTISAEVNKEVDTLAGNSKTVEFDRISIGAADSVMTALGTMSGDTFIVEQTQYDDIGDGAANLKRRIKRVNTAARYYTERIVSPNGDNPRQARRVWPNLADSKAAVIVMGIGLDTFTIGTLSYPPISVERERHGNGLSTVTQMGGFTSNSGGRSLATGTDSFCRRSFVTVGKLHLQKTTFIKQYASVSAADTFIKSGLTAPAGASVGDFPYGKNEGRIEATGDGKYVAYRVRFAPARVL